MHLPPQAPGYHCPVGTFESPQPPHFPFEGGTEKQAYSSPPPYGETNRSQDYIPKPTYFPSTPRPQPFQSFPVPPSKPQCHSAHPHTSQGVGAVFFPDAREFTMNNPTFVSYGNTGTVRSGDNSLAMARLNQYCFTGAEFDSSERDPPPNCEPGTRFGILSKLAHWRQQPPGEGRPVLWLRGPAGVGKSAIMQTFAEDLSRSDDLGCSLFFSRPNKRSDPAFIIPTLAYQLAIHNPTYKTRISHLIEQDPSVPQKSMKHQFTKLITEPLSDLAIFGDDRTKLVLIDGLDECDSEQAQCELVRLIILFVREHPKSFLRWVVSSRPEYHLKAIFERPGFNSTFRLQDVPADGSEARKDVEKYLNIAFEKIRNDYPDIVPVRWPSSRQFLIIAKAANGLFAFASTVVRFVGEGLGYGDPVTQLESVISTLDHHAMRMGHDNPLHALDALYTHILSNVPSNLISTLHLILGFYLLRGNSTSLPLLLAANILDMRQNILYHALQRLHSLLDIPPPQEAHKKSLGFFHKSFSDYLTDKTRSGPFWLDMKEQSPKIADCYICKLEFLLEAAKCQTSIPLSWDHPADTATGMRVLREVKQNWFQLLPKIAMKQSIQNQSEFESLVATINRLKFNAFDITDALGFINLINWISSGSPTIWNQLIFEELSLEGFKLGRVDTSRTSVYYRTRPDRWGYWTLDRTRDVIPISSTSTQRKYLEKHALNWEVFLEDFSALEKPSWSAKARVLIIGRDPMKRCAVILTSTDKQEIQPVVRYYFPLKY